SSNAIAPLPLVALPGRVASLRGPRRGPDGGRGLPRHSEAAALGYRAHRGRLFLLLRLHVVLPVRTVRRGLVEEQANRRQLPAYPGAAHQQVDHAYAGVLRVREPR